jgi:hypothetical protein
MGQPGGLMAFYYGDTAGTQLLATVDGLQSDGGFDSDPVLWFTRVDPVINFSWDSVPKISGTDALRIVWKGFVNIQSSSPSCTIEGVGSVTVILGTTVVVPTTTVGAVFSATFSVTANTNNWIEVQYDPSGITGGADPSLSLKYTSSSTNGFTVIVPPDYLSKSLAISSFISTTNPITVSPGLVSATQSQISFPSTIAQGQSTAFSLIFADTYGNTPSSSSCLSVVMSVNDFGGNQIPNAFGTSTVTLSCSSDISLVGSSYTGSVTFQIIADGVTISAVVSWVGNSPTPFTLTQQNVNIRTPSTSR